MQSLAGLHPRRVLRRAHQVAAVVEVDVEVSAVPAGGCRVEQPAGGAGHLDRRAGDGGDLALHPLVLEAATAGDRERAGRHGQRDVAGMEVRPVGRVPLVRHAVGEPGAAARVGHRPPGAVRRGQPQGRRREGTHSAVEHVAAPVDLDLERPGHVDGGDARAAGRNADLLAGHGHGERAAGGGVDDDVDGHRRAGDGPAGRADAQAHLTGGVDADDHDARRRLGADHVTHRGRPVARALHRLEDRAEQREPRPAEHVRQRVLAPAPAFVGQQPAVVGEHLDHPRREVEPLPALAAHVRIVPRRDMCMLHCATVPECANRRRT